MEYPKQNCFNQKEESISIQWVEIAKTVVDTNFCYRYIKTISEFIEIDRKCWEIQIFVQYFGVIDAFIRLTLLGGGGCSIFFLFQLDAQNQEGNGSCLKNIS